MSKRFLKTIALASTITLTLLGGTRPVWGMWKVAVAFMTDEEQMQTAARHKSEKLHHHEQKRILIFDSDGDTDVYFKFYDDIQSMARCWDCYNNACAFGPVPHYVKKALDYAVSPSHPMPSSGILSDEQDLLNRLDKLKAKYYYKHNKKDELIDFICIKKKKTKEKSEKEQEEQIKTHISSELNEEEDRKAKEQLIGEKEENIGSLGTTETTREMWEELFQGEDEKKKESFLKYHYINHVSVKHYNEKKSGPLPYVSSGGRSLYQLMDLTKQPELNNKMNQISRNCITCNTKIQRFLDRKKKSAIQEQIENTINVIPVKPDSFKLKVEEINERIHRQETVALNTNFIQERELEERGKRESKEQFQREQEENIGSLSAKEEKIKPHIIPESNEEENSLFSTISSLRQIKLYQEEAEESTEIIKKMMRIIGIKTDDFSDCTGNIFAKKCLDRLNDEMGAI